MRKRIVKLLTIFLIVVLDNDDIFKEISLQHPSTDIKMVNLIRITCSGCQDEQPNQEAHYGGCMPYPDEN